MAFVVFAGQSNMGGPYTSAADITPLWRPDPKTLIWDASAHAWAPLQPGVNSGYGAVPGAWGPEVQFAIDFRARFPDEELRIVKSVHGGTGLAANTEAWVYDWSPTSQDELFARTTDIIREASAAAGGIRPSFVFWGQGEEDANYQAAAQAYDDNLPPFFAAVRQQWMGDPAGRIGFFRIGASPAFAADVRAAQLAVDQADANATSFDTRSYPLLADGVHFASVGYDLIGDNFFRVFTGEPGASGESNPGGPFEDSLTGGVGADTLGGSWGSDTLRGGEGDDLMTGGDAFDDMLGNQGRDTLSGDAGDDWVVGGKDGDRLLGGEGGDIVYGNIGADVCDGGPGNDLVRGGQDDDLLFGRDGNDWLSGDKGDDTVSGGAGADIFHTFGDAGLDRIIDFNRGEGDRVQLDPGTGYSLAQVGADTVISLTGGARMVLVGVTLSSLPDGWIFGA